MNKKAWKWRILLLLSLLCLALYYWLGYDWMLTVATVGIALCVIRSYANVAKRREEQRQAWEEDDEEEEQGPSESKGQESEGQK